MGRDSAAARLAEALPGGAVISGELVFSSSPSARGENRWAGRGLLVSVVINDRMARPGIPVWVEGRGEVPTPGSSWKFRGSISRPEPARNPGAFHQKNWLNREGIFSVVRIHHEADIHPSHPNPTNWLVTAAEATHSAIRRTLEMGVDPSATTTQLVIAMTLGDVGPVASDVIEAFQRTGTYHLFSVSGLHVGILGALLWLTLTTLGMPRHVVALLILPALFYYALVTGWRSASIRAATMGAFVILGMLTGRPAVVMNSLLAAAFFILLIRPAELFSSGFQLSFLVVAGLIIFVPAVSRLVSRPMKVDPFIPVRIYTPWEHFRNQMARQLSPLLAVSLVAWLVSIPVTAMAFHEIPLTAVPVNTVCVPLAFTIMAVAVMSLVGGLAGPAVAAIFNNTNSLLAAILIGVVETAASLPFAVVPVAAPRGAEVRMTVLDFAAGGGLLVETSGAAWLVDCGSKYDADSTLLPFLKSRGIRQLDGLLITHGDARHIGGGIDLIEKVPPHKILLPSSGARSPTYKELETAIARLKLPFELFSAGSRVDMGGGVIAEVLYPPAKASAALADDNAAVIMVRAVGWRILLASDAGPPTGHWLIENAPEALRCDILIKGSHRSGTSDLDQLWDAASPKVVISTQASFPPSEVVPSETRDALARRHIQLITQDQTGALTLFIDSDKIRIKSFLPGPVEK
ncbi:MAG: hypothetical protein Fur0032_13070 [Terrimicrobiaceae bacterium]